MYDDPEISAMSNVLDALKGLDNNQVKRVLDWATSKFGLDDVMRPVVTPTPAVQTVPLGQNSSPNPITPVTQNNPGDSVHKTVVDKMPLDNTDQVADDVTENVHDEDNALTDEEVMESEEDDDLAEVNFDESATFITKSLGLERYENMENLFLGANVNTVGSRILLAAAFLQEKKNLDEVSSYEINSGLKKMGYGVTNITTAINSLLSKQPPLMKQTKKEGDSKQSKRKFMVTPEGLELAKTFLKNTVD